jgi:hypothetical protein
MWKSQERPLSRAGYRTCALVFACGVVAGSLLVGRSGPASAHAQIPDPGAQRVQAVQVGQETNRLLRELLYILRNDTLKVRIIDTDKTRVAPRSQAAPRHDAEPGVR